MKIKINKEVLKEAVKKVAPAADRKGNIPILSNILLAASDNTLSLYATDLDIGIATIVNCEVIEEGNTTVNAQKLMKLVSSLSVEEVECEVEGNMFTVRTMGSRFSLATLPPDEFPQIKIKGENEVSLPSEEIDKAIRKVAYAASRDEVRYNLMGVYLNSNGERIDAVATDGHRLALYVMDASVAEFGVIILKRTLGELKRLLKGSGEVKISTEGNQIFFEIDDTYLFSSVIEGEYPDYMAVIPEDNPLKAVVNKDEFLTALKEVSVIYERDDTQPVIMIFNPDRVKLVARRFDSIDASEEAEVEVPCEYNGEEFEIAFNVKHMVEAVGSFDSDTITISMDGPMTQVLLESSEEPQIKCVIMPMKI
ncbi:DNA polymerase III subunit beta [Desulfurobacterium sp.]